MKTIKKVKPKRKPRQKLLPAPDGSAGARWAVKLSLDKQQRELDQRRKVELDPQLMIMQAVKSGASVDFLERLLTMSERIQEKQARAAYRDAMAAFQAECPIIVKGTSVLNKDGESVRYKYAQIDAIVKEVKPFLSKHGFSYQIKSKTIEKPFEGIEATVISFHVGGHSEESTFSAPKDKYMVEKGYMTDSQAWLAAQSFSRRIAFCNVFGIMTGENDVDGNGTEPAPEKKESKSGIGSLPEFQNKDREKKIAEANEKFMALSDYVKKGFGILKYKEKQIYLFCEKFGWEDKKVRFEIDKIIAAKEGSK